MNFTRTTSENLDFQALVSRLDAFLAEINGDDHRFYSQFNHIDSLNYVVVAYTDNVPVGCGAFKPFDAKSVEIKRMYVDLAQRNRGIGGAILAELEGWSRELGYYTCVLETSVKLPAAVNLYSGLGYEPTPKYGQYVDMPDSVCFKKTLLP